MKTIRLLVIFSLWLAVLALSGASPAYAQTGSDACWVDEWNPSYAYCHPYSMMRTVPVRALLREGDVLMPLAEGITVQFRLFDFPRQPTEGGVVIASCTTDATGGCTLELPLEATGAFVVPALTIDGQQVEVDRVGNSTFMDYISRGNPDGFSVDPEYPYTVTLFSEGVHYLVFYPPVEKDGPQVYTWSLQIENPAIPGWVMTHPTNFFSPDENILPSGLKQEVYEEGLPISQGKDMAPPDEEEPVGGGLFDPTPTPSIFEPPVPEAEEEPAGNVWPILLAWLGFMLLVGGFLYLRLINPDLLEGLFAKRRGKK